MNNGVVYIVGAGPGCADLITLRGLRAIRAANVIVIDYLLPQNFLDELGVNLDNKEIHCLQEGAVRKTQDQINNILLKAALQGKIVARVKTGDPHIFARGIEEQTFLSQNGIRWEYIPGISVLSAGVGLADLALTSRGKGRCFAAVSARCSGGGINLDLPKADTLIIFMGVSVIEKIVEKLLLQGWSKSTPVAILQRASMPFEKRIFASLANISSIALENDIQSPAIMIIGAAAEQYEFDKQRPTILFTGLDPANFRLLGNIIHFPVIEICRNNSAYEGLSQILMKLKDGYFKYVVITSKVSARLFLDASAKASMDSRIFANCKIIVAGRGTAELMQENGITPDITPEQYGSKGILEKTALLEKGNVLVVQSATASEAMANSISEQLGETTHIKLHSAKPVKCLPNSLPRHDIVYFTCPSAVRAYWDKYGKEGFLRQVWCIGDVTKNQLKKLNIDSEIVIPYVS